MRRIRTAFLAVAAFAACGAGTALAQADAWPARVVRVIVPFTPGASTDLVARMFAQKFSDAWGQQLVVDNRGGAGGGIGAEAVAKSEARRLHAAGHQPGPEHLQRAAAEESSVRGGRSRAGDPARLFAADHRGASAVPAQHRAGDGRLRQAEPRQGADRLVGHQQQRARRAGDPEIRDRRRHHPRALPGDRAVAAGRRRRQYQRRLHHDGLGRGPDQVGAAQGPRDRWAEAHGRHPGRDDLYGAGDPQCRRGAMDRTAGAGQDSGGDHREDQPRGQQGAAERPRRAHAVRPMGPRDRRAARRRNSAPPSRPKSTRSTRCSRPMPCRCSERRRAQLTGRQHHGRQHGRIRKSFPAARLQADRREGREDPDARRRDPVRRRAAPGRRAGALSRHHEHRSVPEGQAVDSARRPGGESQSLSRVGDRQSRCGGARAAMPACGSTRAARASRRASRTRARTRRRWISTTRSSGSPSAAGAPATSARSASPTTPTASGASPTCSRRRSRRSFRGKAAPISIATRPSTAASSPWDSCRPGSPPTWRTT